MGWMRDIYAVIFNQPHKMKFKIKSESDEFRFIN